jgi:hypothetical protein
MAPKGRRLNAEVAMSDIEVASGSPSWAAGEAAAKRLDPLVRYMIVNWALGALAGIVCASALLIIDPFGLRPLLWRSDVAVAALLLLYSGFMTTFGGLVCAAAVMFPDGFGPKDYSRPDGGLGANVKPRLADARSPARLRA